ncbi:methyltransferase domain-containing protein [Aequorivita marina]|uniref:methyltransferase domain-containing protein n=1 Tax=Aequorivita marina TaxID=3073654 RepID=UPI00287680AD|nr:methyltransferase domain-containing protein [Aequorivita sp. S2608]MDS1297696.1 methyltransferase domain-containing protein [Aequorivita sp. S2608]
MITFSNKYRSEQKEIMDSLDFRGTEMQNLLKDLKTVNKWLGGNSITIDGLKKLLITCSKSEKITILDIGCGDGELLRKCADFGRKNNYNFELIGVDFNDNILQFAKAQSEEYLNIEFINVDVFSEKKLIPNCDIALCTLFLHHFNDVKIEAILNALLTRSRIGVLVNDLERNWVAFNLFKVVSQLILKTKTANHDGLVSIARGFKRQELVRISGKIPNQKSKIHWRWAYRFQWILKKEL